MTIRIPTIEPPILEETPENNPFHTLNCELITPLYGGGVHSATVDLTMPIRATAIRGQLRFWWRLLAKNKWKTGNSEAIRQAEFSLWGGMSNEEKGAASKVFIRVKQPQVSHHNLMSYKEAKLDYVTFPASNETDERVKHDLLNPEGVSFAVNFHFAPTISQEEEKQVIETFRWWANFGGLGFRSRRGMGAFWVKECTSHPEINKPLTEEEVKQAGCQLVTRNAQGTEALKQLQTAIDKFKNFRQGVNMGRNSGKQANRPGRSRWPEPDAIRTITKSHASQHEPEHPAGQHFPRAVFGLPILYHFVGRGEPSGNNEIALIGSERHPSPLILRPIFAGKNKEGQALWKAAALVLPYQHLLTKRVALDKKLESYPIWDESIASKIRPINENQGNDPMQAFLNFFVK